MSITAVPTIQTLTIADWHPTMSANGSHGHWSQHQRKHDVDRDRAWAWARDASWTFVPGKVRLTITLVYPRKYRIDVDNLVAKCKGVIDGLKKRGRYDPTGFFTDDSTDWLELVVRTDIGPKATAITLERIT